MSAATSRAFPGLPTSRSARLAYFEQRARAREAADPDHWFKVLYAWAEPANVASINTTRMVNGRVLGLSEHHELMRRCYALRAWCAQKLGNRNELRVSLFKAGIERRLAHKARLEGR
jgi:hypothetical protein